MKMNTSLLESLEDYHIIKEKMIKAESCAIISEDMELLQEAENGWAQKVKQWFIGITEKIKQFIKTARAKISEFINKIVAKVKSKGNDKSPQKSSDVDTKSDTTETKKESPKEQTATPEDKEVEIHECVAKNQYNLNLDLSQASRVILAKKGKVSLDEVKQSIGWNLKHHMGEKKKYKYSQLEKAIKNKEAACREIQANIDKNLLSALEGQISHNEQYIKQLEKFANMQTMKDSDKQMIAAEVEGNKKATIYLTTLTNEAIAAYKTILLDLAKL